LSKHPLLRALRVDKMTLAALEATLIAYSADDRGSIPLWRMALEDAAALEERAKALAAALRENAADEVKIEAVPSEAVAGGGSSPGEAISSWSVAIVHPARSAAELARTLRDLTPPVVARVSGDRLMLDLRTVEATDDAFLAEACAALLH